MQQDNKSGEKNKKEAVQKSNDLKDNSKKLVKDNGKKDNSNKKEDNSKDAAETSKKDIEKTDKKKQPDKEVKPKGQKTNDKIVDNKKEPDKELKPKGQKTNDKIVDNKKEPDKELKTKAQKPADKTANKIEDDDISKLKEEVIVSRAKYKTYMIIAIIIMFTVNVIGGVFAYLFMEYRYDNALERASQELYQQMHEDFLSDLEDAVTYDILKAYAREYYLPDNYSPIGIYVNQLARKSVVEMICGDETPSVRATGVVLNDDGYVLTNAHVVTHATTHQSGDMTSPSQTIVYYEYDSVKGIMYGASTEYDMEIIAYDPSLDLAIVKFENPPEELQSVVLSYSEYANIGEEAVVIGNALGLGISVTTGVVMSNYNYQELRTIQTDTLAWEGNSGSGVFNVNGEMLGVMSFEFTDAYDKTGVSYSVATEEIIDYIEYLNSSEEVSLEEPITYTLSQNLPEGL